MIQEQENLLRMILAAYIPCTDKEKQLKEDLLAYYEREDHIMVSRFITKVGNYAARAAHNACHLSETTTVREDRQIEACQFIDDAYAILEQFPQYTEDAEWLETYIEQLKKNGINYRKRKADEREISSI